MLLNFFLCFFPLIVKTEQGSGSDICQVGTTQRRGQEREVRGRGCIAGTGQTWLQLVCCALATEPGCPMILERQTEVGTEGEQRGQIMNMCLSQLQVEFL